MKTNNIRNAGRKALPVEQRKIAQTVYIIPSYIKLLKSKYGSLTKAIHTLISPK